MSGIVSLDEVLRRSANHTTFDKGVRYYEAGKVSEFQSASSGSGYEAWVDGHDAYSYRVQIFCDHAGKMSDADCSCPANSAYYGFCKHIVAVLIYIIRNTVSGKNEPIDSNDLPPWVKEGHRNRVRSVMEKFQTPMTISERRSPESFGNEHLFVQYEVELVPSYEEKVDRWVTVQLRVGPKRVYVVKDIAAFLEAVMEAKELYFTKTFIYDPDIYRLSDVDMEMLQFLSELARDEERYRQLVGSQTQYIVENGARTLYIPSHRVEEFLKMLPPGQFVFANGDESTPYQSLLWKEGKTPFSFFLTKENSYFTIENKEQRQLYLITEEGLCIEGSTLYTLSNTEIAFILPFHQQLERLPEEKLYILPEQMEEFASTVLPLIQKEGCLQVDEPISEKIIHYPLHVEVHLEQEEEDGNERLIATISYHYGENLLDPLRNQQDRSDEHILIRDTEKEQRVMGLFETSGFHFNGDQLYLEGEEELFTFLYEYLSDLEKEADVYSSKEVDQMWYREREEQILPALELDRSMNWLEIEFDLPEVEEKELQSLLRALKEKKKYYRLPSGTFMSLQDQGMKMIQTLVQEEGGKPQFEGNKIKLPALRALQVDAWGREQGVSLKRGGRFRRLVRDIQEPETLEFAIPSSLTATLRDYQRYGFQWMKTLAHYRLGGILADDMGLGKTLQALAFILSEREEQERLGNGPLPPSVVVAPSSLIYNWESECERFAPHLRTVVMAGTVAEREELMRSETDVDLLITSYPLLRRDIAWYEQQQIQTLILDEAQSFKNRQSQTAQAVKRLHAGTRFALSGTPIENRIEELNSILDVILPGLFPSQRRFRELSTSDISKRVRPFILRRMKQEVLTELPDKIETNQLSELTMEQKAIYLATLGQIQTDAAEALRTKGFQKSRMKILAALTRLRQICCHPSLYLENYSGDAGKFAQLRELVEELILNKRRVLIFSQFTSMLALIQQMLKEKGYAYYYLDGQTPSKERVEMVSQFNQGEKDLFLISLKAGGTGLNLTGADTVILYDLWWNPAVEQQAADRAHRFGQKKTVQVIKLIARGTIEEKINQLQQKKRELFDQVIQPGEQMITSLGEDEIRELLSL
ncbi:DEAD/DEAH box helicase [Mechercharimyces sp. CAU 1602]|uniref:DEAD/DEAH box helicase n=1 Tax=Mechercharimyces sp. CAU 1602 TaxID=2973933 RepID=UPI002161798D|nr:DEAD/DEAH box helicase [Mechercharimyces sp. CAU 1602]MCS1351254.1 DEAD/DEAH box helicase [Mechercharimyces sp. CAU 1602]